MKLCQRAVILCAITGMIGALSDRASCLLSFDSASVATDNASAKPIQKSPASASEKAALWRTAVAEHTPGSTDSSALMISAWSQKEFDSIIGAIEKIISPRLNAAKRLRAKDQIRRYLDATDREISDGSFAPMLLKAAILHTDIARLELNTAGPLNKHERIALFIDGQIANHLKNIHWDYARRLWNCIPAQASKDALMRQWYIATTAHLLNNRLLAYASENLQYAIKQFPQDEYLLFFAGSLHETWAAPSQQNIQWPPNTEAAFSSREEELRSAQKYYRQVLQINPEFIEARLRLGRVLSRLGHSYQAIAELQNTASAVKNPQLEYYALLFLGNELAGSSRRNEAKRCFERAAALYPRAQSPLIALSRLARSNDEFKEAWTAVNQIFSLSLTDYQSEDPLWNYDFSHVRNAQELMRRMYATVKDGMR